MQKRAAHIPRGLRLVGEICARIAAHDWEATPVDFESLRATLNVDRVRS